MNLSKCFWLIALCFFVVTSHLFAGNAGPNRNLFGVSKIKVNDPTSSVSASSASSQNTGNADGMINRLVVQQPVGPAPARAGNVLQQPNNGQQPLAGEKRSSLPVPKGEMFRKDTKKPRPNEQKHADQNQDPMTYVPAPEVFLQPQAQPRPCLQPVNLFPQPSFNLDESRKQRFQPPATPRKGQRAVVRNMPSAPEILARLGFGYTDIKELGSGNQAKIYYAKDKQGNDVAIKIFKNSGKKTRVNNLFKSLKGVVSTYLLELKEKIEQNGVLGYSMDFHPNTLQVLLKEHQFSGKHFSEEFLLKKLMEIALGLEVLHKKGITHLDIKPDNILIAQKEHAVIADFDMMFDASWGKDFEPEEGDSKYCDLHLFEGTLSQKIVCGGHNDVLSLGFIMLELATLEDLPNNDECATKLRKNNDFFKAKIPTRYSEGFVELISAMAHYDIAKRPSAQDVATKAQELLGALSQKQENDGWDFKYPGPHTLTTSEVLPTDF